MLVSFLILKLFVEDSKGFKRFSNLCIKAYLLLRENVIPSSFFIPFPCSPFIFIYFYLFSLFLFLKQNNLIISLFTMMLGCGIPGVSRFEDLYFLRTSLALDMSKKEVILHVDLYLYKYLSKSKPSN